MTPIASQNPEQPTPEEVRSIHVVTCEDQALMRDYIVTGLSAFGIQAASVADGQALYEYLEKQEPEIVILDIGLPGEDGYSIADRLRRERPHLGIIMLTARDQTDDRVLGLDCGADLYFAKPVDLRELASAVGSLHRRLATGPAAKEPPTWRLDVLRSSLITPQEVVIPLTDNELRFLRPLLDQPGEVIDREVLSKALEQRLDIYAMRRMETMLSRLRSKVQRASPDEPLPIRARHGRGYAFLCEADTAAEG